MSRQKLKYLGNEKSFWGEIISIFCHFQRAFNFQKSFQTWECAFKFLYARVLMWLLVELIFCCSSRRMGTFYFFKLLITHQNRQVLRSNRSQVLYDLESSSKIYGSHTSIYKLRVRRYVKNFPQNNFFRLGDLGHRKIWEITNIPKYYCKGNCATTSQSKHI